MLRVAQGARGHILKIFEDTGTSHNMMRTGRVVVNLDENGRCHCIMAIQIDLQSFLLVMCFMKQDLDRLTGAFVLIGSSAAGLKDIHSTNLEAAIPGGLIHLQSLHQMLSGHTLKSSDLLTITEIVAGFLISLIMGAFIFTLPIKAYQPFCILSLAYGTAYAEFSLFQNQQYMTNAVMITSQLIMRLSIACYVPRFQRRSQCGANYEAFWSISIARDGKNH